MNRIFLTLFGLMLTLSLIDFIRNRRQLPAREWYVIFVMYVLIVGCLVALHFQYNMAVPTGRLTHSITQQVKMWIEHW